MADPTAPIPLEGLAGEYVKASLQSFGYLQVPEVVNVAMNFQTGMLRGLLAFLLDHMYLEVFDSNGDSIGYARPTTYINTLNAWMNDPDAAPPTID